MSRHIAVYLRVSTDSQDHKSQEPDLERWLQAYSEGQEIVWHRETYTGKTLDRPVMRQLEQSIQQGEVLKLVVWRLDRLGRTASQTLRFLERLDLCGVGFVSVKDGIDASTASGRLMRTILAGFAEYEREVISERVRAGIARAHAAGKRWGGRKQGQRVRLTPEVLNSIKALLAAGISKTDVARNFSLNRSTIYEAIRLNGGSNK